MTLMKAIQLNIKKYQSECDNDSISLTMRSAVSALTIGHYYTLLQYCLENKFNIKPLIVTAPTFLQVCNLPIKVKEKYLEKYQDLLDKNDLQKLDINHDFNESDPTQYKKIIKLAIAQAIGLLTAPTPDDNKNEIKKMIEHCAKSFF